MTGLALPLLQCCPSRSTSSRTRQHLRCRRRLRCRGSSQSLRSPRCRTASVNHGKRGRAHLTRISDLLSTATHPPTLQRRRAQSWALRSLRSSSPRATLCRQRCRRPGKPRGRSGWKVLPELSSNSTMPMRYDPRHFLPLGVILATLPGRTNRAALADNLSKQILLNTFPIGGSSEGLPGRSRFRVDLF